MESIKRALESIGRMWANLTATQRVIVGGAAALMAVLLVFSSVGSTQAWVRVAGAEGDRTAILKKLQERNQKYEVRGTDIYVPKEDADRIVLELAGEGTVSTNAVWKFLEQSDVFASRWDKEKRFQIALQTRLEGMIRSVESVRNASVVINPGSTTHQLGFVGPKPSASVQVELKDGMELSGQNVQAIAGLVASAVPGVEVGQVHIMDTRGKPYRVSRPGDRMSDIGDLYQYKKRMEEDIEKKIRSAFAFSTASVVVGIKVKSNTIEKEDTKYGNSKVIESRENSIKKGGTNPAPVRIKGDGGTESNESPSRENETQNENYEKRVVDQTHSKESNPAGDIERVTIGVIIPVEEGAAFTEAERQLSKLRDFVLKAEPQLKAEDVSVQFMPTKKPAPIAEPSEADRVAMWLSANWTKIVVGAFALAALLVLLRVIQGNMAKDTVEELQALTTALTEEKEAAVEFGVAGEPGDLGRLKQGLQDMVGRNPQGVAASLKSFMSGR